MRKLKVIKIWVPAFLLVAVMAGCSDPDKHAVTGNPGNPLTPPTVTAVTPPNGTTLVCPNTAIITATFSKPMNPATLTTTSFTLTSGGASVSGTVSYVAATMIATFTPSAALAASTTFTATITTAAQDQFGNALASNFVWTFTTSPTCPPPSGAIALGSACSFGILAGSTVTNVAGTATTVSGDVGVWPGTAITGFGSPASITGAFHAGDTVAMTAQGDLTTAYNNAAGAAGGAILSADIGGQTLPPGVYKTTSAQPSLGITGNLTLSGNGIYIFQIVSSLTTAAGPGKSKVILAGGAVAHDVFWQVGSSATLGTNSVFAGTIMANASITLGSGAI